MTTTAVQRTAMVTGAARGVGAEIARDFAELGYRVALIDLDEKGVKAAAAELRAAGAQAVGAAADVSDLVSFEQAYETVVAEVGPVDVLVNNAGWSPTKLFVETSDAESHKVIGVNYVGVLNGCRLVVDHMIQSGFGRIISIASDAARVGTAKEAVYAGAKAAVIGFSKSLTAEVARHGVTVNVVSPGSTDTPLLRGMLNDEQIAKRLRANPSGRLGAPADISAAVAFFASDAAGYITGQIISVNGGATRVG